MGLLKYWRWQQQCHKEANSNVGEQNHSPCMKWDSSGLSEPTGALRRRWMPTRQGWKSQQQILCPASGIARNKPVDHLQSLEESRKIAWWCGKQSPRAGFESTEGFSKKQSEQHGTAEPSHRGGGAFHGAPRTSPLTTSTAPPSLSTPYLQTTQPRSLFSPCASLATYFFKSSSFFPKMFLTLSRGSSSSLLSPVLFLCFPSFDSHPDRASSFSRRYTTFIALFLSVTFTLTHWLLPFLHPPVTSLSDKTIVLLSLCHDLLHLQEQEAVFANCHITL